ncbi:MAG: HemK family protein methyltransferase [Acidimicrobiia bacterium]
MTGTTRAQLIERLTAAGCIAADAEADELLRAAIDDDRLRDSIARREQGEPLAWITGTMVFCGRRIHVEPGVYVPRIQTEPLAARAAALLPSGGRAVDLCTGAGAIAASLRAEVPTAAVVGIDLDPLAVRCAHRNGVPTVLGDLATPLRADANVDVVTAVAPYVPTDELHLLPADVQRHEPRSALDGGVDGLDVVRRVVSASATMLGPGGWLLLEIGGEQAALLRDTLSAHGFATTEPWFDDDGDLRGLATQRGD